MLLTCIKMKIVLCFILFLQICNCIKNSDRHVNRSKYIWEHVHSGIYRGNVLKNDDHQTNRDYHSTIIKPCSLDDLKCIRRFFAHNSKCKPVEGRAPDPYMLQQMDLPIAQANLTFSLINAQVKGLNEWKINNFFINKATDKLVLEVVFDRIVVASPGAKTACHRKGKETVEVIDFSIIEYYGLSFTLTIPQVKDLKLSNGNIFTYVVDANPLYTLGSAVARNTDADFVRSVASWLDKLDLSMREVWYTQGPDFFSMFLQSTICDFRDN